MPPELVADLAELLAQMLVADILQFPELTSEPESREEDSANPSGGH